VSEATAQTEPQPPLSGLGIGVVMLVAGLFSAASGFVAWSLAGSSNHAPQVVILNPEKIINAKLMAFARDESMTPERASQEGRNISKALDEVVASYRDAGFVVLHGGMVLGAPEGSDVTKEVAARVGVDL